MKKQHELASRLHDASIEYEGTRIQGLLCLAGDELLRITSKHQSGFDSWQSLRGYLMDYGIVGNDDEACRMIEDAYSGWPSPAGYRNTCGEHRRG